MPTVPEANDTPNEATPPSTLPPIPADAETKRYVLALVRGRLKWFPML